MGRQMGQQTHGRSAGFRERELKICELCGWLNLECNAECFVCGWHGHFERDPEVIRAAVEIAVRRNGRLALQHLTDPRTYREPVCASLAARLHALITRAVEGLRAGFRRGGA